MSLVHCPTQTWLKTSIWQIIIAVKLVKPINFDREVEIVHTSYICSHNFVLGSSSCNSSYWIVWIMLTFLELIFSIFHDQGNTCVCVFIGWETAGLDWIGLPPGWPSAPRLSGCFCSVSCNICPVSSSEKQAWIVNSYSLCWRTDCIKDWRMFHFAEECIISTIWFSTNATNAGYCATL